MISQILSNRYRILSEIGSGGMAKVYQAEDMNSGQLVAVKVMYPQFSEDTSYVQRFIREAKLAELLDSPHIVKILDYGSSRDTHYLVMEYVEGQSVRDILEEKGSLSWQEALTFVDQICRALETANDHKIVHRDIKPQNMMITDAGLLKVLDFGIARGRMLPSLTQSGFVGSPYYIAPEQAMGEEVDIRSDIYSTGIVLYEFLSGEVPFDAKSPWSIISKHITVDVPQLDIEQVSIPQPVQMLLKYMVAKNPDDRIQDPKTVRQIVSSLLGGGDFPASLATSPPASDTDAIEKANALYETAIKAIKKESWQESLGLLNQVLDLHPGHPEAANQRIVVGQNARLSALYQAASRALESRRWQEAIDELSEIMEIDGDFKDAAKLLLLAREAITQNGSSSSPNPLDTYGFAKAGSAANNTSTGADTLVHKNPAGVQSPKRPPAPETLSLDNTNQANDTKPDIKPQKAILKPLLITLVLILVIAGGIWGVSRSGQSSTSAGPNPTELFEQAQVAVAEGDFKAANQLLTEALALDPANILALDLQAQLELDSERIQQLGDANIAIGEADWTKASEILEQLRRDNPDFHPETVDRLLCDTYLARGQARLNQITSSRDQATVQAALTDFQDGQKICQDHDAILNQISLAKAYLSIFSDQSAVNTIIESLEPIVETNPTYANGQASQNLYNAYLNRGDIFRQQGDNRDALTDYQAAAALQVTDPARAQRKIELLENSGQLEQTTEQAVNTNFRRGPVTLLGPEPGSVYEGELTEIDLVWEAVPLADDEYYAVTVRWFVGGEARYWGGNSLVKEDGTQEISCTETCTLRVSVLAGYGEAAEDKFDWWVTILQRGTETQLSPPSEEWHYHWKKGGG